MHWVWRATLGISAGLLAYHVTHFGVVARILDSLCSSIIQRLMPQGVFYSPIETAVLALVFGVLPVITAVAVYGAVTAAWGTSYDQRAGSPRLRSARLRTGLACAVGILAGGTLGVLFAGGDFRLEWPFYIAVGFACWVSVGAFRLLSSALGRDSLVRHCRCGYDLTGNTSGICPECGTHVQQATQPPQTRDPAEASAE